MTPSGGVASATRDYYADAILDNGPLPAGYDVVKVAKSDRPRYRAPDGFVRPKHPLEDVESDELVRLAALSEPQPKLRRNIVGVKYPAITYQSCDFVWKRCADSFNAVYFALSRTQKLNNEDFRSKLAVVQNQTNRTRAQLYHPVDRQNTVPFRDEDAASRLARYFGRNLIIACPEISKDGSDWNNIWSTDRTLRPAVVFRYSTGRQEDMIPLFVGCLPKRAEYKSLAGNWFVLIPREGLISSSALMIFRLYESRHEWNTDLIKSFGIKGFNNIHAFQWIIVAAHRAILHDEIAGVNLGNWIYQFGSHCMANNDKPIDKRPLFEFKPQNKYGGRSVTFAEISAWIFKSPKDSAAKTFLKRWDDAIEALDQSDSWPDFRKKMMSIPFKI